MDDLFTVKIDPSSIQQNNTEQQLYILLVDPKKMKMIYEFKSWVRLLFSIDGNINLVFDNAVIHDLEDIRILSVLGTVKIKLSDTGEGDAEIHEKLTKQLSNYYDWRESRIADPKSLEESFRKIRSSQETLNSSVMSVTENFQHSTPDVTDTKTTDKNISYNKMKQTVHSQHNCNSLAVNMDCGETDKCGKQICPNEQVNNSLVHEGESKNNMKNCGSTQKRRPYSKPFSVYEVLKQIRPTTPVDVSLKDEVDSVIEQSKSTVENKNNVSVCYDKTQSIEECPVAERKTRKRVRKHKSKSANSSRLSSSFYSSDNSLNEYSVSFNQTLHSTANPKHIRFDPEEECVKDEPAVAGGKDSYENSVNGIDSNELITVDSLQECINEKMKKLKSLMERENNTNNEVNHAQTYREGSIDSSNEVSKHILSALINTKKENSCPPVFCRFSD